MACPQTIQIIHLTPTGKFSLIFYIVTHKQIPIHKIPTFMQLPFRHKHPDQQQKEHDGIITKKKPTTVSKRSM